MPGFVFIQSSHQNHTQHQQRSIDEHAVQTILASVVVANPKRLQAEAAFHIDTDFAMDPTLRHDNCPLAATKRPVPPDRVQQHNTRHTRYMTARSRAYEALAALTRPPWRMLSLSNRTSIDALFIPADTQSPLVKAYRLRRNPLINFHTAPKITGIIATPTPNKTMVLR